jgi:hypothetical protein
MITVMPILMIALAQQEAQIKHVRIFTGGTFGKYVRFLNGSRAYPNGINIYQEDLFTGMGPIRSIQYSDGTVKLDPSLPSYFAVVSKDQNSFLKSAIFPEGYCREDQTTIIKVREEDEIALLQTEMTTEKAPGIDASLRLGNGLQALGYRMEIHPFFKDMRVNVKHTGNWRPEILDSIASCIGGKIRKEKGVPVTYHLEPDVNEIRKRGLATLDLFYPSLNTPAGNLRERIRYELLKNCSSEFLRRWIDAAGKVDRMSLPNEKWCDDIRKYRDMFFDELREQSPKLNIKTSDEYKAMPIYIDLAGKLQFGVVLIGPDGKPIHI